MTYKVIVLHGSYGSPEGNWFPWLGHELHARGYDYIAPRFPTPEGQNPENWQRILGKEAGPLNSDTILIGHSIGVGFALWLLNRLSTPIAGTFLVAGFVGTLNNPTFDTVNAPFFKAPFDWQKIRGNAGKIFCYAGDNDPYVLLARPREISKHLQSSLTVIEGGGHLNAESHFTEFDKLKEDFLGAFPL